MDYEKTDAAKQDDIKTLQDLPRSTEEKPASQESAKIESSGSFLKSLWCSKRILYILLPALFVVMGGVGAYLLFIKNDPKKPTAPTISDTQSNKAAEVTPAAATVGNYYISYVDATSGLNTVALIDGAKKTKTIVYTAPDKLTNIVSVHEVSGSVRIFVHQHTSTATKGTEIIAVQDGTKPLKQLYSVTSDNTSAVQLWTEGDTVTPDGGALVFYEYTSKLATYKQVDMAGKVTTLLADVGAQTKKDFPTYNKILTPRQMSTDGKTLYIHALNCLNCDGGASSDLIAFDIVTQKFTKLYSDDTGYGGSWTYVKSNMFVIESSQAGGLGIPSYENSIKNKTVLSVYDAATKKGKRVFESSGDKWFARFEGVAREGNVFYVAVAKPVKGTDLVDKTDPTQGHTVAEEIVEVRAYQASTGDAKAVMVPTDLSGQRLNFLTSMHGQFIYSYSKVDTYDTTALTLWSGVKTAKADSLGSFPASLQFEAFSGE